MKSIVRSTIFAAIAASMTVAAPGALAQSSATGVSRVQTEEGVQTIVVTNVDGKVSVELGGRKVPEDQIIRGEGGLHQIKLPGGATYRFWAGADGGIRIEDQPTAPSPPAPPRGRIGVTLGEVDSALADHLGLSASEVFLITGVSEGLPAQRAGLKQHDIVTHINGESPVSIAMLTRLVAGAKPGEEVRFRVLRRGQPHEISVEIEASGAVDPLSAFRAELATLPRDAQNALDIFRRIDPEQFSRQFRSLELGQEQLEKLRVQFEPLRGQGVRLQQEAESMAAKLRESQAELAATLRQQIENLEIDLDPETLESVRKALLEAARALENVDVNVRIGAGPGGLHIGAPRVEFLPDGQRRGAVVRPGRPAPPAPPAAGHPQRLIEREIEARDRNREEQERLKRLEERMERLEALLERLVDRAG
ncbi:MAG: PDZ domain-containing protein [Phycisphaeraceae bacterium]|nr:MAG: PDZ domain-containing protein [Phycisphaeraceae bacterium]